MRVLDVACGTGNVAVRAALAGGDVVGLDLTPELFDAARRHAAEAGVEVEWVEGDAELLPFDDASFERVFSSFGVIFAPRHAVAVAELARVLAPGGAIALTAWTDDGFNGEMGKVVGSRLPPPPPSAQSPVLWGSEEHVRELFEPHDLALEIDREEIVFRDDSVEAAVQFLEDNLGTMKMARATLGDEWPEVHRELIALHERFNRATDGSAELGADYLLIVARKPV
jgi:SAM-dependent methyltransferase